MNKILIASDHAGFKYKELIKKHLSSFKDIQIIDVGTPSDEKTDYPIWGEKLARQFQDKVANNGIVICGTGIGISNAVNKAGVNAAVTSDPEMAKEIANQNIKVIAIGERVVDEKRALKIIDNYLKTLNLI